MFGPSRAFGLGSLFGFPIRIHLSFLVLLGLVFLFSGGVAGVLAMLLVGASVIVHELGHSLVARHLGVPVGEIGLHFFGGAAQIEGVPRRPGDEIAIAAAGPAVSFALAGLGLGVGAFVGEPLLATFGWINLVLALFNLVPAFPSDGGRILRALLARRYGFVRGTELAVTVARVACAALVVGGLATGSLRLALIGAVLWTVGTRERDAARLRGDQGDWRAAGAPVDVEYLPPRGGVVWPRVHRVSHGVPVFVWRR
jgi:Zn-dependent protease